MDNYRVFDNNIDLYSSMLQDIRNAKKYVYLETYVFGKDKIGGKFRDALVKKARQNVEVKVLLDGLGSMLVKKSFYDLKKAGGKIRFFMKFKLSAKLIKKNMSRDHRKLLVIDDHIAYIGSANTCERYLKWRELTLRMEGDISKLFKEAFLENFIIAGKKLPKKEIPHKTLYYKDYEIIRDIPSGTHKKIRSRKLEILRNAKKEVFIVTPYFVPDEMLREELIRAARRGADVRIIIPKRCGVFIVDMLRQRYLGELHSNGVKIYYHDTMIHAKMMLVDSRIFSLGSCNMDYRSFILHYEINLIGTNKRLVEDVRKHFMKSLENCKRFDYERWRRRGIKQRILERLLSMIRYFL